MNVDSLITRALRTDLGNYISAILSGFEKGTLSDNELRHSGGIYSGFNTVLNHLKAYEAQIQKGMTPNANPSDQEQKPTVQTVSLDAGQESIAELA